MQSRITCAAATGSSAVGLWTCPAASRAGRPLRLANARKGQQLQQGHISGPSDGLHNGNSERCVAVGPKQLPSLKNAIIMMRASQPSAYSRNNCQIKTNMHRPPRHAHADSPGASSPRMRNAPCRLLLALCDAAACELNHVLVSCRVRAGICNVLNHLVRAIIEQHPPGRLRTAMYLSCRPTTSSCVFETGTAALFTSSR